MSQQNLSCKFALQRGKPEDVLPITLENKSHPPITQGTHAIVEQDGMAHGNHFQSNYHLGSN